MWNSLGFFEKYNFEIIWSCDFLEINIQDFQTQDFLIPGFLGGYLGNIPKPENKFCIWNSHFVESKLD